MLEEHVAGGLLGVDADTVVGDDSTANILSYNLLLMVNWNLVV